MRLFAANLIDAAAVTLPSYSSQATGFPAANLRNPQRGEIWRTTTGFSADEFVILDLGSAQAVTACIVLAHTLTAGDSAIKIQANATNSWGAPSFDQTLTWSAAVIAQIFSTQTYRYWRFLFTKSAASAVRDVGRLWLGTYYTATDAPDYDGFTDDGQDFSLKQRAPYGAQYGEARAVARMPQLEFSAIPNAQKIVFRTICDAVKTVTPFFLQVDETATGDELAEYLYLTFRARPTFKVAGYDSELKWDTRLNLEESL